MWARERFGAEVVWAIEDCRHLSARLERDLMGFGQKVVRVPPKSTARPGPRRALGLSLIPSMRWRSRGGSCASLIYRSPLMMRFRVN